jgi:hypothetical protein
MKPAKMDIGLNIGFLDNIFGFAVAPYNTARDPLGANGIARARTALARIIAASVSATAWGSLTRSNDGSGGSTARQS